MEPTYFLDKLREFLDAMPEDAGLDDALPFVVYSFVVLATTSVFDDIIEAHKQSGVQPATLESMQYVNTLMVRKILQDKDIITVIRKEQLPDIKYKKTKYTAQKVEFKMAEEYENLENFSIDPTTSIKKQCDAHLKALFLLYQSIVNDKKRNSRLN